MFPGFSVGPVSHSVYGHFDRNLTFSEGREGGVVGSVVVGFHVWGGRPDFKSKGPRTTWLERALGPLD